MRANRARDLPRRSLSLSRRYSSSLDSCVLCSVSLASICLHGQMTGAGCSLLVTITSQDNSFAQEVQGNEITDKSSVDSCKPSPDSPAATVPTGDDGT